MVGRTTKSVSVTPELISKQLKSVTVVGYLILRKNEVGR